MTSEPWPRRGDYLMWTHTVQPSYPDSLGSYLLATVACSPDVCFLQPSQGKHCLLWPACLHRCPIPSEHPPTSGSPIPWGGCSCFTSNWIDSGLGNQPSTPPLSCHHSFSNKVFCKTCLRSRHSHFPGDKNVTSWSSLSFAASARGGNSGEF